MFGQIFWSFAALIVSLGCGSVYALFTPEEEASMRASIQVPLEQCAEEHGISKEKLMEIQEKDNGIDVDPCFVSCMHKKIGTFTSEGMYDADKTTELTKPHVKCEKKLAIIDEIGHACVKVNDEKVSDGDKGCERAVLLNKCLVDYKNQMKIDHPERF